jgi:hypothetical protein
MRSIEEERHIIMVDEAVFTKQTVKSECWRGPNEQFKLVDFRNEVRPYAVVAGISGT